MDPHRKIIDYKLDSLNIKIPLDNVLVKYIPGANKITKGGVLIPESSLDEADNIDRLAVVVKIPNRLRLYEEHQCTWKSKIEIKVGDQLWINHIESLNAPRHVLNPSNNPEYFKSIKYSEIILAKRGDDVIACNGYVLLEEVYEENVFGKQPVKGKGIIRYFGERNTAYHVKGRYDPDIALKDGQMAYIQKESYKHARYLEDNVHAAFSDKRFILVQRWMIAAIE